MQMIFNNVLRTSFHIYKLYIKQAVYRRSIHDRTKRAAGASDDSHAHHESHTLLEELTHIFHIGSMAILSFLVLEVTRKYFLTHEMEFVLFLAVQGNSVLPMG